MDIKTIIKDYGNIVGYIIGFAGLVYGFYKDRKLREVENRSKTPFFIVRHLEIEADRNTDLISGASSFVYPPQLRTMEDNLYPISEIKIFDDYPDERIVGIVLENKGAHIRVYNVKCKEEHIFHPYKPGDPREIHKYTNCYTFRYRFRRANIGRFLKFKIKFEAESGFRGKQVWLIEKGILKIKRVKPKSM